MSARNKLNVANFTGCILVAGAFGAWVDSLIVFLVVATILLATNLAAGAIRVVPRKRR